MPLYIFHMSQNDFAVEHIEPDGTKREIARVETIGDVCELVRDYFAAGCKGAPTCPALRNRNAPPSAERNPSKGRTIK